MYFITICCYNRTCLFGDVVDGEMQLNAAGKAAEKCWKKIPEHFKRVNCMNLLSCLTIYTVL